MKIDIQKSQSVDRAFNRSSEKLAPRSRSFRKVFVKFSTFSDILGLVPVRRRAAVFGCVGMQSDAFWVCSEAFGHFCELLDVWYLFAGFCLFLDVF